MEIAKSVIPLSVILWLAATSASDSEEAEVTTEGFEFPTYQTTANVTESPDDNGMVIGDIPPEVDPSSPPTGPQSKEEEKPSTLEQQPVLVTFPDNHKNFTPSQYLGDQDFPPYYNHLSTYQQQYKNYNEQKQIYSRKPIKFEENVLNNYYLPQSPESLDGGGSKKTGNLRVNRNPFPYAFESERAREKWHKSESHTSVRTQLVSENEKTPEGWYKQQGPLQEHHQSYQVNEKAPEEWFRPQSPLPEHQQHGQSYQVNEKAPEGWYKHTGHVSAYERPNSEHALRGHKETGLPYYVVAHGYPHEGKFFQKEIVHSGHQHLKKDDKGSAWKKVFHVLTALVPLGLLLASLSPNVISINSTSTTKTTRQRSEDAPPARFKEEDVLKLMKKYGVESLNEAQCEDRILCELAVEGGKSSAGPIEKGFWFLANQTPWDVAEKAGMNDLFKAIKSRKCETYKCHAKVKSSGDSSLGKKFIWKHKTTK